MAPRETISDGGDVRTHLANERTFLAWVRTGLTCVAIGLGALQLLDDDRWHGISLRHAFAVLLVAVGSWCFMVGRRRHRVAAHQIDDQRFTVRHGSFGGITFVLVVASVVAFLLVERS